MISSGKSGPVLTQRPVLSTLFWMGVPMLGGTFAMNAFNLTDTWFVAQLGTRPLAAMGFTFPVIMLLVSLTRGLGMGGTAAVSHALGRYDQVAAKRISTHALILGLLVVIVVAAGGLLTIDPVFRMLGAEPEVMPLIRQYMTIWYFGVAFMVLPMMAADIIRATGDTVSPSLIMVAGSLVNIVLDPIMIFGFAGFPALGIRGAALATLISRALGCFLVIRILHQRHQLIAFERPIWSEMWGSWKEILHIGLPSGLSNILMPISGAVITFIVAGHGEAAVAAVGAASRIEMFAFMVPMALGISLVPFVGQNYGAQRLDRVKQGQLYSTIFAFGFGLFIAVVFWLCAGPLAHLFSKDEAVVEVLTYYLKVIPIGYGMMEIHRYNGFFLNGIRKPLQSTALNVIRIVCLIIPLSYLGDAFFGLSGVFWGRVSTDILAGAIGFFWSLAVLNRVIRETPERALQKHEAESKK